MLPNSEEINKGESLSVKQVSRHHQGLYVCSAGNGVGQMARAEINLHVLCRHLSYIYGVS